MSQSTARLVDLRAFRVADLEPVLEAQALHWHRRFRWDRRPGMELVSRLIDRRLLLGRALVRAGAPVGYAYYLLQGRRAILSDLFVADGCDPQLPGLLLQSTLNAACSHEGVLRVEAQLPCLDQVSGVRPVFPGALREFTRALMLKSDLSTLPEGARPSGIATFCRWSADDLDAGSRLIRDSYQGHVDALINEDYASVAGGRRALVQCTRAPPQGQFFPDAGIVARQPAPASLAGICLGGLVADGVGHIAQLCVAPRLHGQGLGSELLRRGLRIFAGAGCEAVSLTVTASNSSAVRLYERHGFRTIATFPALVWQRA